MYFVLFQQGHNNLIKSDEGIYNVTVDFYLKKYIFWTFFL